MATQLEKNLMDIGFSDKAARLYLAALDLGEATVKQLAERSKIVRTSIYYVLEELQELGALTETKRDKKIYYIPEKPQSLLKLIRARIHQFEATVPEFESRMHSAFPAARTLFFYGVPGFKNVWEKVFTSPDKQYDIIAAPESFLRFVREKYIRDEIIQTKRRLGFRSRQLITDSQYARKIVAKDKEEHRVSKILPPSYRLTFTTIICRDFVAFISPRHENLLIVIESQTFAQTQRALFSALWDSLR